MNMALNENNNNKPNYDRWKPGTKLACMIALKRATNDPSFFDNKTFRFHSITWHTVAENLNKEYPDFSKRFTNINVKDRYDRVLKHHKVFRRMANSESGFSWNPRSFCFEFDEELLKYEQGIRKDDIINSEINIARFLLKPGHIELEYFHRYIYKMDEIGMKSDSVINSPSFIDDAISRGILRLTTGPSFFKDFASGSLSSNSNSASFSGSFSSSLSGSFSAPVSRPSTGSISTTGSLSSLKNLSSALPKYVSTSSSIGINSNTSNNPNGSFQSPASIYPTNTNPNEYQASHSQLHLLPTVPTQATLGVHQQVPSLQQHQYMPQMNLAHQTIQQPLPPPPPPPPPPQTDLDFASLMSTENPGLIGNANPSVAMSMIPSIAENNDSSRLRKKFRPNGPSHHIGVPNSMIQTGFMGDHFESDNPSPQDAGHPSRAPDQQGHEPPPPQQHQHQQHQNQHQQHQQTHQLQHQVQHQPQPPPPQPQENALEGQFEDLVRKGLSTGEAILQIHKEHEMMLSVVSEHILSLRINRLINFEDFQALQELQAESVIFVKTAYKRYGDDAKLLELINVYLNRL